MDAFLSSIPPALVYVLVGLVVGVESLGIPLPGEIVLVAAALMSSHHELAVTPHLVAACAVVGAVVGDSIGYLIGARYGDRLFAWLGRKLPKHVNPPLIAYAEHIFRRYGIIAVFIGRFVALLRIFAGPLAGSLKMHYPRFLIANICGAICWAGGTTYLVYYLGATAEKYMKNFSYVGLAAALVFAVLASTILRRKLEKRVEAYAVEHNIPLTGDPATGESAAADSR